MYQKYYLKIIKYFLIFAELFIEIVVWTFVISVVTLFVEIVFWMFVISVRTCKRYQKLKQMYQTKENV